MYAISESGYRYITPDMHLNPGESRAEVLAESLLLRIKADQKRFERAQLLRSTDWTQMADAPLSAAQKATWALYRQALRDLPSVAGFPDVPWPTPPALNGAAASGNEAVQLP